MSWLSIRSRVDGSMDHKILIEPCPLSKLTLRSRQGILIPFSAPTEPTVPGALLASRYAWLHSFHPQEPFVPKSLEAIPDKDQSASRSDSRVIRGWAARE